MNDSLAESMVEAAEHYAAFLRVLDIAREEDAIRIAERVTTFVTEWVGSKDMEQPQVSLFESPAETGWIALNDIAFHSLCEHHMLPFFGSVSIAYLPNQSIVGFRGQS